MDDQTGMGEHGHGDEEGGFQTANFALGAPIDSAFGKAISGDATNTIETHGITDGWWTSTSPEG